MGIDIRAYKNIDEFDCNFNSDGEPVSKETGECLDYDEYFRPYKNPDFPGMADDIKNNTIYKFKESDLFFSASYSGYNRLRDKLAKLAGYKLLPYEQRFGGEIDSHCVECWNGKKGSFSELINFSDCEGAIGAKISAKLLKDFSKFQEKADQTEDEYFLKFYNQMRSAFEMASNNGCVNFG